MSQSQSEQGEENPVLPTSSTQATIAPLLQGRILVRASQHLYDANANCTADVPTHARNDNTHRKPRRWSKVLYSVSRFRTPLSPVSLTWYKQHYLQTSAVDDPYFYRQLESATTHFKLKSLSSSSYRPLGLTSQANLTERLLTIMDTRT